LPYIYTYTYGEWVYKDGVVRIRFSRWFEHILQITSDTAFFLKFVYCVYDIILYSLSNVCILHIIKKWDTPKSRCNTNAYTQLLAVRLVSAAGPISCFGYNMTYYIFWLADKYLKTFEVTWCVRYAVKCEQVFKQTLYENNTIILKKKKNTVFSFVKYKLYVIITQHDNLLYNI